MGAMGVLEPRTDGDLAGRTSRGAVVTLAGELGVKLLAMAVTVLVAVRLDATAYGIVLLAIAAQGLADVLTNPMLATVLVREPRLSDHRVNVAWTVAVVRGALMTTALWYLAPWLTAWFGTAEVLTDYLRVLAFAFVLTGLVNLHAVQLRRDLRFLPAFLLDSVSPLTSSTFALAALLLSAEPIWLIAAHLAGPLVGALSSLLLIARRPRFVFDPVESMVLLRGAAPLLLNCVLGYLLLAGDGILVGYLAGATALGIYGIGLRWSQLPIKIVAQCLLSVLMPVYAVIRDDEARTRNLVTSALSAMMAVIGLLAGLMLAFAGDFFLLLGGGEWSGAGAVARAFVPFVLAFAVNACLGPVLIVHGKLPWLNRIMAVQAACFLPALYLGHAALGLPGVALSVSATAVGISVTMMSLCGKLLDLPMWAFGRVLVPPLATAAVAAAFGWSVIVGLTDPRLRLLLGSAAAIAVFVFSWEWLCRRTVTQGLRHRSLLHLGRMLAR